MADDDVFWLEDPTGIADFRRWDGSGWTTEVLVDGVEGEAAPAGDEPPPELTDHGREILHQVQHAAGLAPSARGTPRFDDLRIVVVNHRARWIASQSHYDLMDDRGLRHAVATRRGANEARARIRYNTVLDYYLRLTLDVERVDGEAIASIERRRWFNSVALYLRRPDGSELATITQRKATLPRRFDVTVGGAPAAEIIAADKAAKRITITAADGRPLGRVIKPPVPTGQGVMTSAQRFVVERTGVPGSDLDLVVGLTPLVLDLALASTYSYEVERDLKHDPARRALR